MHEEFVIMGLMIEIARDHLRLLVKNVSGPTPGVLSK